MVERCVRDAEVASSNLVASILFLACFWLNAGIAQSVEHFTRNEGVVSSSLISSSTRSLMSFQWKRDQAFFLYPKEDAHGEGGKPKEKIVLHFGAFTAGVR